MSSYVKSTNFATKDNLTSGDPLKIVKGTEIDTEFNNIATAIATKADTASPTFTGTPLAPTASPGTNTTQLATTAFVTAATGTLGTMSTQNANNVAITGGTVSGLSSLSVSGTATATTFSGAGTSLTGTASALNIGGNAATATSATSATSATTATTATNATNILGNSSQAYANNIGSRAINTTYTNSTGKPIWVAVAWDDTGNGDYSATVNGNLAYFTRQDLYPRANVDFIVPISATYSVSSTAGQTPDYWYELR